MLKKHGQKYIIKAIIALIFTAGFCSSGFSNQDADDLTVKPAYSFTNKGGRDPFSPRYMGQPVPVFAKVDITSLALLGVTETEGVKAALFVNKTGQSVGFVFTEGRMYGDNNEEVTGITGEIKSSSEVLLVQGDKEVLYTLNEQVNSLNIRPTDTAITK